MRVSDEWFDGHAGHSRSFCFRVFVPGFFSVYISKVLFFLLIAQETHLQMYFAYSDTPSDENLPFYLVFPVPVF